MQTKQNVNPIVDAHTPMKAEPIRKVGLDANMAVTVLVGEVMAHLRTTHQPWRNFALRVIALTTDGREAFMKQCKSQLKEMKENNIIGNQDKKQAAKAVASATVELSRLNSLARAFNKGATIEGLCQFTANSLGVAMVIIDDVSWFKMWQYAATFSTGKAGRPSKPWLVKLGDWLEDNPAPTDDEQQLAAYNAMLALYNRLATTQ
jgi:hypothetical protein